MLNLNVELEDTKKEVAFLHAEKRMVRDEIWSHLEVVGRCIAAERERDRLREALWPSLPKWAPTPEQPQQDFYEAVAEGLHLDRVQNSQRLQDEPIPNMPKQTTPTNCFSACIASVLGIAVEQVPKGADGASWNFQEVQEWLSKEFGLQLLEVTFGSGGTIYPMWRQIPCIITGKSPRECATGRHAVVAMTKGLLGFEVIHDPHESGEGLADEPTHACFFVPIEPDEVFLDKRENSER